jgi:hypothetical protein
MPMVALHEPIAKKIFLSPLRVTGATIRGVGYLTMGAAGVLHLIGDKVAIRRKEEDKFMPEAEYLDEMMTKEEAKKEKAKHKKWKKCFKKNNGAVKHEVSKNQEKDRETDFKVFNEKGEKTWKDLVEDDNASTAAGSLVDEKLEKEFV